MALFSSVLCAVDHSSLAPHVLRQAVGIAGAFGARLTVLTVYGTDARHKGEAEVQALLRQVLPPGATYVGEPRVKVVRLTQGSPADAVLEFVGSDTDLLVAGTHARTGLSRWFLGSTSAALLERATCPTLLVPPGALDIVTLGPAQARIDVGAVLAAVDPAEHNHAQLAMASAVATAAGQPLVLMTVADTHESEQHAQQALVDVGSELGAQVHHLVVRRGSVPAQIAGAAVAEQARLVVMGLRAPGRGLAGEVATEVLRVKAAAVLAVPAAWRVQGA